ncbi:MAG: S8 family serine peptidase, partial [Nanoarchaeota archaeon]
MRKLLLILALLLLILPVSQAATLHPLVEKELEHGETVKVRVTLKDSDLKVLNEDKAKLISKMSNKGGKVKIRYRYPGQNMFSAEVDSAALNNLKSDPQVESIDYVFKLKLLLDTSVPVMKANNVWPFQIDGINLTGRGEVICILDTGVNYHHGIFGNCTLAELQNGSCERIVAGYDFGNSDSDPIDVDGHGTNVAGIVISNDTTYRGVAPEAKIVALKVFNDSGSGNSDDLDAAIQWCISNSSRFNISVITMSVGFDNSWSNTTCNNVSLSTSAAIASAIANNISVIAASGNEVKWGVSAPGCIENVSSVGAVYDADYGTVAYSACTDSTTGTDNITCFSNRGPNLYFLAPGSKVNSANKAGGFSEYSGTSQATP